MLFRSAIRNNKSIGNDVDGLYAVLTEFKSGNKNCEHPVEYGSSRFLTPVRLIGKSEHYEKSYKDKIELQSFCNEIFGDG